MASAKKIFVEVAFGRPDEQKILGLQVKEGSTLAEVIHFSNILAFYPEIDLSKQKIGVFGRSKLLSDIAQEGDRIEIYRDLIINPKEARRKRSKNSL